MQLPHYGRRFTKALSTIYQTIAYISFGLGWVVGLVSNLAGGKGDANTG
jgi:hypothetical protein